MWRDEGVSWDSHKDFGDGLLIDALRRALLLMHRSLTDERSELTLLAARCVT